MDSYVTGVTRFWMWFWAVFIGCALIAGIIVGGWQLGWWMQSQAATKNYQITQNGVSNQDTNRTQINSDFQTLTNEVAQVKAYPNLKTAVQAQEANTANDICARAEVVTGVPLPADQAQWVTANCTNGTLSTSSQFYQTGSLP